MGWYENSRTLTTSTHLFVLLLVYSPPSPHRHIRSLRWSFGQSTKFVSLELVQGMYGYALKNVAGDDIRQDALLQL